MRKALMCCMTICLLAPGAWAATKTKAKAPASKTSMKAKSLAPKNAVHSGIRVSVVRPFSDYRIDVSQNGQSFNTRDGWDRALGIGVGYAHLPVRQLGWTSNLTLMEMEDDGTTFGFARLDGNVGYAVLSNLNFKGGLNLSQIIAAPSEQFEDLKAQFGAQLSMGIQVSRNVAIDVGWMTMHQSNAIDGQDVEFRQTGIEVGVNGTF